MKFQSLDWVERLSDPVVAARPDAAHLFQSLDWVERLSDHSTPVEILAPMLVSIPRLG